MTHDVPGVRLPADLDSTLVGVLTGHDPQVVQRWHSARSVGEIAEVVGRAGWSFGHLDGARSQTKAEILAALGETLGFPAHYGQNLDALADCLDDLVAVGPQEESPAGVLLLWDAWSVLAAHDPDLFELLVTILTEHSGRRRPFVVLLRTQH